MMKIRASILLIAVLFPVSLFSIQVTVGKDGDYKSVREAVAAAESPVIIELLDPVYTEEGIVISTDVVIRGRGKTNTVIQAAEARREATDRVFTITAEGSLELYGLTVRHGNRVDVPMRGGGIDNEGRLLMEDCSIADNDAVYGAGLFTRGKTELFRCEVYGNSTFRAPLEIVKSGVGCMGSGGGIKTEKGGALHIENCAVYGNYSQRRGGGLFVACESRADIINSTFTGNKCNKRGGGICSKGDVYLSHVTIARNESIQRGSGFCNMGKALMYATLIADNSYGDFANIKGGGIYGSGFVEENVMNLISDGSLDGAASGNARLKAVKTDADGIPYIAIGLFSPARNAADQYRSPETDQRGILRDLRPDIGAYEIRPVPWRP